jgi:hypothetical protein
MLINDIRGYPNSRPSRREGRLAEGTGFAVHPREGVWQVHSDSAILEVEARSVTKVASRQP